jgi:DNA-binding CsgD family transcriptional regulator
MYKSKNNQKPKDYWTSLIAEVSQGSHRTPPAVMERGVKYETNYERRSVKYTLNEPFTSIYFTQREAECVIHLLQGKTMNEVGASLKLSPRTVEYYLGKIKRKLNCRKKREVIKLIATTDFVKNFKQDPYNR